MARIGPAFDEAVRRRNAYKARAAPLGRTVIEREVGAALGWSEFRGRGARRQRLRQAVKRELRNSPQLYDLSYRRAGDTIRLRYLSLFMPELLRHLCLVREGARRHIEGQAGLPNWLLAVWGELVVAQRSRGRGARFARAVVAASDRIIAAHIGISTATVRRRRRERFDWWENRAS